MSGEFPGCSGILKLRELKFEYDEQNYAMNSAQKKKGTRKSKRNNTASVQAKGASVYSKKSKLAKKKIISDET